MSGKPVTVRPLAAEDRAAWDGLWQAYLTFYEVDLPFEVSERTWSRLIDPLIDLHGIVVLDGRGEVIGIAHYLFHPATWSVGPYCYLEDLYVDPTVRGSGFGRALIETVYAEADKRDAARVYWHTHTDNTVARGLYDRLANFNGFVLYRR